MLVPKALGGAGLSTSGYARVMQEVGGLDASLAVTLGAHLSIGYQGLLLFGTEDQKKRYLPKVASGSVDDGRLRALTEPSAGSDAAAIRTHADLQPDGNYRLSRIEDLGHERRLCRPLHGFLPEPHLTTRPSSPRSPHFSSNVGLA